MRTKGRREIPERVYFCRLPSGHEVYLDEQGLFRTQDKAAALTAPTFALLKEYLQKAAQATPCIIARDFYTEGFYPIYKEVTIAGRGTSGYEHRWATPDGTLIYDNDAEVFHMDPMIAQELRDLYAEYIHWSSRWYAARARLSVLTEAHLVPPPGQGEQIDP